VASRLAQAAKEAGKAAALERAQLAQLVLLARHVLPVLQARFALQAVALPLRLAQQAVALPLDKLAKLAAPFQLVKQALQEHLAFQVLQVGRQVVCQTFAKALLQVLAALVQVVQTLFPPMLWSVKRALQAALRG